MKWLSFPGTLALKILEQWLSTTGQVAQPGAENPCRGDVTLMRGAKYPEKVGCIAVGDNVFIGSGTRILYNVRIGSNVIIGANSLINKDIPDNSVVAGVPAKVIKTFDEYQEKRALDEAVKGIGGEAITKEAEEFLWQKFWKDKGAL